MVERNFAAFPCRQFYLDRGVATLEGEFERAFLRLIRGVHQPGAERERRAFARHADCAHERISNTNRAGGRQKHIAINASIPVANSVHKSKIPANRLINGRRSSSDVVIAALAGAAMGFWYTRKYRWNNLYGQYISPRRGQRRDVKDAALESTFHRTSRRAVDKDFGTPVHAIQIQPQGLSPPSRRHGERGAPPMWKGEDAAGHTNVRN